METDKRHRRWGLAALVASGAFVVGCASQGEASLRRELRETEQRLSARAESGDGSGGGGAAGEGAAVAGGSVEAYLAEALRSSPSLRAAFERWRAAVLRIPAEGRLPEPELTYGYYVQSVETRVGPQRHRLGLRQWLPWPTEVTEGSAAAVAAARAAGQRFEAAELELKARVTAAYYGLWLLGRTRAVLLERIEVLAALGGSLRAWLPTGGATLADLAQVDLSLARARDSVAGLEEERRAAEATLRAVVGLAADADVSAPGGDEQEGGLPAEGAAELVAALAEHPRAEAHRQLGESREARARQAWASRMPRIALGLEWIETGEAVASDVPGSGTDPLVLTVGVRLPLWGAAYGGVESAARAEAAASAAEAEAATRESEALLATALSAVAGADRRMSLYRDTLIPQAEAAHASVLTAYQVGRSTIAAVLRAEEALLDLELGLLRAQAAHCTSWARLEQVVGRRVEAQAELLPDEGEAGGGR